MAGNVDVAAVVSVGIGSLFLYAAIKGKTVLGSIKAVVQGKSPDTGVSLPSITGTENLTSVSSAIGAGAGAGALAGAGGSVPAGSAPTNAGHYNYSQLEQLWVQAGGAPSMAALMAAIATAESSGNPNATGGVGEKGLWQINPAAWGSLATYDPLGNARAAVHVLAVQGLGAWSTYTNGAYKQFLQ